MVVDWRAAGSSGAKRGLGRISPSRKPVVGLCMLACLAGMSWVVAGCGDRVRQPSPKVLAEFKMPAPSVPSVDMDRIVEAKTPTGPYRVVAGDVLRVEMPPVPDSLSATSSSAGDAQQSYNCRVSDAGTIVLPIVGSLAVGGRSLAEIESSVMDAYSPKYVTTPFPIYVNVAEYSTRKVSVVGAVAKPGIYGLRHDQMSLIALLMEAGGIVQEGAALIEIERPSKTEVDGPNEVTKLALPVKGLNIPFADVALEGGDSIVVQPSIQQYVSVVGLVNRPGNMPYPPGAQCNVIQAIAFAGGLDLVADPRYISTYRLQPNGEVVGATFQIVNPKNDQQLTQVLAWPLRPGDVISVEHTPRTRTNVFFDRIFRISLGLYFDPDNLWDSK